MVQRAESLAKTVGVRQACTTLGVPRSSFYQARRAASKPLVSAPVAPTPRRPRALSTAEKENIRAKLNSARFVDQAPRTVYPVQYTLDWVRRCWTKGAICAIGVPCTVYWRNVTKCVSAEISSATRRNPSRSCWRRLLIKFGAGTSQRGVLTPLCQTTGAGQVALLLSVRHARHVQSVCRRLVAG